MTRSKANHTSQAAKRAPGPAGVSGARIRERRRELHLSLQELAGRTELTSSFLSLIERNINRPSLESLRRVAEALEVPLFYFAETKRGEPRRAPRGAGADHLSARQPAV